PFHVPHASSIISLCPTLIPFLLLYHSRVPPDLPSFPTRRSSDLVAGGFGFAAVAAGRRPCGRVVAGVLGPVDAAGGGRRRPGVRSEEHTSELQSRFDLVCRLLLVKKK